MKKIFKLEELECAACAAKMEDAIGKMDKVNEANISFITQKLTIDADEADFDEVLRDAQKVIKKIERRCRIVL